MKKARTNKRLGQTYTFRFLNWIYGTYYKWKNKIWKPDTTGMIKDGLYPGTPLQEVIVAKAYHVYLGQGKSPREARRLVEKKLRIKIIPGKK